MSTPAFLQGILGHERGLFRNVVSAVLEEGRGHRPDPKARSSQELIEHLIGHGQDLVELLDDGVIDRLGSMDEETWMSPAKFMAGEQLIMEAPRMQLAWILFLDAVHHRGQLSTHLRPMGSSVPSIYGPSADDQGEGH